MSRPRHLLMLGMGKKGWAGCGLAKRRGVVYTPGLGVSGRQHPDRSENGPCLWPLAKREG